MGKDMAKKQWRKTPASEAERAARANRHFDRGMQVLRERTKRLDVDYVKIQETLGLVMQKATEAAVELEKPKPDLKKVWQAETLLKTRIADREAMLAKFEKIRRTFSKIDLSAEKAATGRLLLQQNIDGLQNAIRHLKNAWGEIRKLKRKRGIE